MSRARAGPDAAWQEAAASFLTTPCMPVMVRNGLAHEFFLKSEAGCLHVGQTKSSGKVSLSYI